MAEDPSKLTLVVGMTRGHDAEAFGRALAALEPAQVVAVASRSPRSQSALDVGKGMTQSFARVSDGTLVDALSSPGPKLITGSLYVVGETRHIVCGVPMDPAFPLF